jgi:glycosyltransferase involved in cell wall biosynthesis
LADGGYRLDRMVNRRCQARRTIGGPEAEAASFVGDDMDREPGLVSIGVPVYNGENYLAAALNSILGQSYKRLEIIVSDNGSSDATEQVCRRYASLDPRIRYCRSEINRGSAWNFNTVFNLGRGEYFKWWAHDDVCDPSYIGKCVSVLERDPSVVLCFAKTIIIDERGNPVREYDDQMDLRYAMPDRRFRQTLFREARACNAQFGVMRADILERTKLIGGYAASDQVLLAELALRGKIHQVQECLFFRRDHPRTSMRMHSSVRTVVAFVDPQKTGRFELPHWRWLAEYSDAIRRSPLVFAARSRCYFVLAMWSCRYSHKLFKDVLLVVRNGLLRVSASALISQPK